jgi:hypothetical protein
MTTVIPANELKTRGITAIKNAVAKNREAIISVRGKERYIVMSIDEYGKFREYELEAALEESRQDVASGRTIRESAEKHIKRIKRG